MTAQLSFKYAAIVLGCGACSALFDQSNEPTPFPPIQESSLARPVKTLASTASPPQLSPSGAPSSTAQVLIPPFRCDIRSVTQELMELCPPCEDDACEKCTIETSEFDLNDDAALEVKVELYDGWRNHDFRIVERGKHPYCFRTIFSRMNSDPKPLDSKTKGWKDLLVETTSLGMGPPKTTKAIWVYDGSEYSEKAPEQSKVGR